VYEGRGGVDKEVDIERRVVGMKVDVEKFGIGKEADVG
jgi:hypothetical protein